MVEIKKCPLCNSELFKPTNLSWLHCPNPNCQVNAIRFKIKCSRCKGIAEYEFTNKQNE